MLIQKQNYKGFVLEICSYKLTSGKWGPKVILREDRKYEIQEKPLIWKGNFATKKEADAYALAQAEMWIEKNK